MGNVVSCLKVFSDDWCPVRGVKNRTRSSSSGPEKRAMGFVWHSSRAKIVASLRQTNAEESFNSMVLVSSAMTLWFQKFRGGSFCFYTFHFAPIFLGCISMERSLYRAQDELLILPKLRSQGLIEMLVECGPESDVSFYLVLWFGCLCDRMKP